jgi:hypothetical protein
MIINVDPKSEDQVNVVQVDSDAADNLAAMREIEDWAASRGFARTTEFWLRRVRSADGRMLFRGICYRITREEIEAMEQSQREMDQRVERMPQMQIDAGR